MICLELEVSALCQALRGWMMMVKALQGRLFYLDRMFSGCDSRWGERIRCDILMVGKGAIAGSVSRVADEAWTAVQGRVQVVLEQLCARLNRCLSVTR